MKIGILGTGTVGTTLATKLVERGHEVKMGARDPANAKAAEWAKKSAAGKASTGSFTDAATFGDLVFNCTKGEASVEVAKAIAGPLADKVLVDVSNALVFSKGPPSVAVDVTKDSVAEQIQRAVPKAKVVKALNTLSAVLMTNPSAIPGDHTLFVSGNDAAAKQKVIGLLEKDFGWKKQNILDLGDLTAARAQEALLVPWLRLYGGLGHGVFNWHVVVGAKPK